MIVRRSYKVFEYSPCPLEGFWIKKEKEKWIKNYRNKSLKVRSVGERERERERKKEERKKERERERKKERKKERERERERNCTQSKMHKW